MEYEQDVAVFWDESIIPTANCSGFHAARFVCKAAETVGAVRSVKYYVDIKGATGGASHTMNSELKYAGITVVDTASMGRRGSAVKMALTDAFIHALDNPASGTIVFVSADPDVCYSISLLRMRGYHAYLLCPSNTDPMSEFQLPDDPDASDFLDSAPLLPSRGCNSSHRPQSPSSDSSPPSGGPQRQAFVNGRTGASSPCGLEAPPALPSSEINAFRERFTSSRPKVNTTLTDTLRPHRHSFSSFGCNRPTEPESFPLAPPFPATSPTTQPKVDLKGKGRAVDTDSTLNTPIILTATSMSASRSNSFDSLYRGPPTNISTAPTSAMPWYRPDFKMGGDGTFKEAGHRKRQGLKDGMIATAGELVGQGVNQRDDWRAEKVEETGSRVSSGNVRSVSESSDGSATPTLAASPTTLRPRGSFSVDKGAGTPVMSRTDLPVSPTFGNSVASPAPERIQIHASPPASNPAVNPVTAAPAPRFSDVSPPRGSPLLTSHLGASQPSPPLPASSGPLTDGIRSATPTPTKSSAQVAAKGNRTTITPSVTAPAAAHAAIAATTQSQTTIPAAPTSTLRTTSSSPTAQAHSPPASTSRLPLEAPPHFNILIQVLREHGSAVDRNRLSSELLIRQGNVLRAAGTDRYSKPFVRYFKAAFEAGIITAGTGKVCLSARYR